MKKALAAILVIGATAGLAFGQQRNVAKPGVEIDAPDVVAEVKAAYDRYNNAVNSGTTAVLNDTFWNDARTIRYGQAENLYGYKEIEGFRANARPLNPPRTLSRTVITTYGRDFAVASTLTYRANQPGKVGRQMQSWVRFPDGWHVVAAHVSTIDEPK
jgi:1-carboxybiuret hydrolase subunit AtzH-like protein